MKIIVAITGATGAIYGVRILQRLREAGAESHLVISRWGARTLLHGAITIPSVRNDPLEIAAPMSPGA